MVEEMKAIREKNVTEREEVLQQAQQITVDYLESFEKIDNQLVARASEMKNDVDTILSQNQKRLQELKEAGLSKLKDQEKLLAERVQQPKDEIRKYEDQLRGTDPNVLLQFKRKEPTQTTDKAPPLETASIPDFRKGENDAIAMKKIFGQISMQNVGDDKISCTSQSDTKAKNESSSGKTLVASGQSSPSSCSKQISSIPKSCFKSGFHFWVKNMYPHIACVDQNLAWVTNNPPKACKSALHLVDGEGSIKDFIEIGLDINGLSLSPDGDIILADGSNKCIKSLSNEKKISILFKTSKRPTGICCLANNDVVVTFMTESKVTVYQKTGKIARKLNRIKFRHPKAVAVNNVNQDIYVCDHEDDFYQSTGKVIAVRSDGHPRFEYLGQGDRFMPTAVCTDQKGRVLITDGGEDNVHILDQNGISVGTISICFTLILKSIDVDREGSVWIGRSDDDSGTGEFLVYSVDY